MILLYRFNFEFNQSVSIRFDVTILFKKIIGPSSIMTNFEPKLSILPYDLFVELALVMLAPFTLGCGSLRLCSGSCLPHVRQWHNAVNQSLLECPACAKGWYEAEA